LPDLEMVDIGGVRPDRAHIAAATAAASPPTCAACHDLEYYN